MPESDTDRRLREATRALRVQELRDDADRRAETRRMVQEANEMTKGSHAIGEAEADDDEAA